MASLGVARAAALGAIDRLFSRGGLPSAAPPSLPGKQLDSKVVAAVKHELPVLRAVEGVAKSTFSGNTASKPNAKARELKRAGIVPVTAAGKLGHSDGHVGLTPIVLAEPSLTGRKRKRTAAAAEAAAAGVGAAVLDADADLPALGVRRDVANAGSSSSSSAAAGGLLQFAAGKGIDAPAARGSALSDSAAAAAGSRPAKRKRGGDGDGDGNGAENGASGSGGVLYDGAAAGLPSAGAAGASGGTDELAAAAAAARAALAGRTLDGPALRALQQAEATLTTELAGKGVVSSKVWDEASHRRKRVPMSERNDLGAKWFNLAAPTMTPELKRDLLLLRHRGYLDPKRHYKGKGGFDSGDLKALPRFFAVGTVQEAAHERLSAGARLTRKERKGTLVEAMLADERLRTYARKNYDAVAAERARGSRGAYMNRKAAAAPSGMKGAAFKGQVAKARGKMPGRAGPGASSGR